VAGALALVGLLVAGLRFGLVPGERVSQLPYVRRIAAAADLSGGTVRVRLVLWKAAAGVAARWPSVGLDPDPLRPFRPIVGYGLDTGSTVYMAVYPPELAHIEDPSAIWDRAHNETLDLLVMRGALGVLAVVGLGVACFREGLRLLRGASGVAERAAVAAPLAALVAHAVEVQFAFSVTATAMMAWLCVGLVASWRQEAGGLTNSTPSAPSRWRGDPASLRWRVYAFVGAALLLAVVVRVEAASVWADTLVDRARALDRAGQWDQSIDLYHRAHALAPWQSIYYQFHAEALYNLARALPEDATDLKVGLLEAADRNLAEARRLDPLELEYYTNAGILHAYWSEEIDPDHLEAAVAFLEQAIRLAPTRVDLRITLAHIYHNHGLYEQALSQYEAALEIDPEAVDAYYGAGMAYLALDQPERAREMLAEALERAPDCQPCRSALEGLK
jgi:tetratricopeptide (TPR) repeat protein